MGMQTNFQVKSCRWINIELGFWQNFKHRFLGPSWTISICHSDICPGNICPCNICPYQEYLSCYWSDFDQTLKVGSWDHLWQTPAVMVTFVQEIFALAIFVHIRNILAVTAPIWQNFLNPTFLQALNFLDLKYFCGPKINLEKKNLGKRMLGMRKFGTRTNIFLTKIFYQHIFKPKYFLTPNFFETNSFGNTTNLLISSILT